MSCAAPWRIKARRGPRVPSATRTRRQRLSSAAVAENLLEGLDAPQAFIGVSHGDALKALRGSAKRIEAVYSLPYVHHATLEPMTATARWTPERVEVLW